MNLAKNVLLLTLSVSSTAAFAWGDAGHETVAYIAQALLTPEAKLEIRDILGPELLAIAATWPDSVRDDGEYKAFADYHLCDEPKDGVTEENYRKQLQHNCFTVFDKGPDLLKLSANKMSDNAKMLIVRYMIHVAGDIHQPLHVGGGLDLGANTCKVTYGGKDENLHHFWDTTLVDGLMRKLKNEQKFNGFFGSKQLAEQLIKNNIESLLGHKVSGCMREKDYQDLSKEASVVALMNSQPIEWIKESAELRHTKAYPDSLIGETITDDRMRPYCTYVLPNDPPHSDHTENYKADKDPSKKPLISLGFSKETPSAEMKVRLDAGAAFEKAGQELVAKQIFKAGVRLAGFLNRIAKNLPKVTPDKSMSEVLNGMSNPGAPATRGNQGPPTEPSCTFPAKW